MSFSLGEERRSREQAELNLSNTLKAKTASEDLCDSLRKEILRLERQESSATASVTELRERLKSEIDRTQSLDQRIIFLTDELTRIATSHRGGPAASV